MVRVRWTVGMADPGNGGPWEWRTVGLGLGLGLGSCWQSTWTSSSLLIQC